MINKLLAGCVCLTLIACDESESGAGKDKVSMGRGHASGGKSIRRSGGNGDAPDSFIREIRGANQESEKFGELLSGVRSLSDDSLISLLKELEATKNSPQDKPLFSAALGELARRDPGAALEWFAPEKMVFREVGWENVAKELAKSHPEMLEKWMLEELAPKATPEARTSGLYMGLMMLKAEQGPEKALEFYANLKDKGTLRATDVINTVFWDFSKKAPAEAEKAARSNFKGSDLDSALRLIALGAGSTEPKEGLPYAEKIADIRSRNRCLAVIYNEWLASDSSVSLRKLGELDGRQLAGILREADVDNGIVKTLAKDHPEELLGMLGSVVTSSSNNSIFEAAVRGLTANGSDKALGLIEGLPDGGMKAKMYGEYFSIIAASDPGSAVKGATNIPAGESRNNAYKAIGGAAGSKGFDETMQLLESVPQGDRTSYLGPALASLALKDPSSAIKLLEGEASTVDDATRRKALTQIGERLVATDPASARKWMESLPPKDQPQAMSGYAREMARTDIEGLSENLAQLPKNEVWAAGVRVLVGDLRNSDPDAAKQWQDQLSQAGFK